jgi:hypothetical protein
VETFGSKCIVNQLMLLRLGFLNTNDVSVLLCKPFKETLSLRGPNPIGIAGNHSKHDISPSLYPEPSFVRL